MPVNLVSNDLLNQFKLLLTKTNGELNIISPFIGTQTANLLADWLIRNPAVNCNIITRFYREDFVERVSSIYGLERLLQVNANIYALIDLHSKLYLFDSHSTIIGSANFTKGGFLSNHELCIIMDDESEITDKANEYFYDLLEQIQAAGDQGIVTQAWIEKEKTHVSQLAADRKNQTTTYYNEHKKGVTLKKIVQPDIFESLIENNHSSTNNGSNYWLKFEGTGEDRVPNEWDYIKMKGNRKRDLNTTYFPRRPSGIGNGDTLFLTIVSYDEQGRPTPMIVGYATTNGFNHANVVNDQELITSPWKSRFPYYVEFANGKVIKAPIKNGIRLVDIYNNLGKGVFPTLRNRAKVSQVTLQSMHFRRSHIRITQEAENLLISELEKRFVKFGNTELGK